LKCQKLNFFPHISDLNEKDGKYFFHSVASYKSTLKKIPKKLDTVGSKYFSIFKTEPLKNFLKKKTTEKAENIF